MSLLGCGEKNVPLHLGLATTRPLAWYQHGFRNSLCNRFSDCRCLYLYPSATCQPALLAIIVSDALCLVSPEPFVMSLFVNFAAVCFPIFCFASELLCFWHVLVAVYLLSFRMVVSFFPRIVFACPLLRSTVASDQHIE